MDWARDPWPLALKPHHSPFSLPSPFLMVRGPWLVAGRVVSVVFDVDGKHYNKGPGLRVLVDGVVKATSPVAATLRVEL